MVFGWIGVGITLDDGAVNTFLNYMIGIQFGALALGAMGTGASLAMASLARAGYEVTGSLARLVKGAIEHQADIGLPGRPFGLINQPPLTYRALAHPATWRAAGGAALSSEAVCVTTMCLAARHISLFPTDDRCILGAIFSGISAMCGVICITGGRQQRVVRAIRTAMEVDLQLKGLLQPAPTIPPVLSVVPPQGARNVGGRRNHLRKTAGD